MATIKNNIITKGFRGMLGDTLVFRQVQGRTIVSARPTPPRHQSELQRVNRQRFRDATVYAKAAMCDPEKKAYYRAKARKLKLPNAYTAAITDFMRKPEVHAAKRKGNRVLIMAAKKGFTLATVEAIILNPEGLSLRSDSATLRDRLRQEWTIRLPEAIGRSTTQENRHRLIITVTDHTGNMAGRTLDLSKHIRARAA